MGAWRGVLAVPGGISKIKERLEATQLAKAKGEVESESSSDSSDDDVDPGYLDNQAGESSVVAPDKQPHEHPSAESEPTRSLEEKEKTPKKRKRKGHRAFEGEHGAGEGQPTLSIEGKHLGEGKHLTGKRTFQKENTFQTDQKKRDA